MCIIIIIFFFGFGNQEEKEYVKVISSQLKKKKKKIENFLQKKRQIWRLWKKERVHIFLSPLRKKLKR